MEWVRGNESGNTYDSLRFDRIATLVLTIAAVLASLVNQALAEQEPAKPVSLVHELSFHAGHVTIEGPMSTLTLCDSVEVTVHRYRLTADRLTLQRTSGGVLVKGPGLVAFCPCEDTPIRIGFSEAKVAPPTDLVIHDAVVRAGGVPVMYTPVLWLRSPNRVGFMSPHFGWRAQDGFWAGSGLHVPLKPSTGTGDAYVLSLNAGVYLRGGWDLGTQLVTPRTTTQIRVDHVNTTFVDVDARGSQLFGKSSLAWTADILQGSRARSGFVSAEAASRETNRFRVELTRTDGRLVTSANMRWEAWRATSLGMSGLVGPQLRLAAGSPIDRLGQIESDTSVFAWKSDGHRASLLTNHSADLGVDARPSVFAARWAVHERMSAINDDPQNLRMSLVGTEARVSVPLVRNWGVARSWSHWIEPFVLMSAARTSNTLGSSMANSRIATAQVGITNVVGQPSKTTAYQLQIRAGLVESTQGQTTAVAVRSRGSGKWLGIGADAVVGTNRSWVALSRIRLGDPRHATISARLEGRTASMLEDSRWFTDEAWHPWLRLWESRAGWTSIGDASIAPTDWLAANGGIGADITAEKSMFEFASMGYRHPCGCLAISATVSQRLGRSGWDAFGMLDLMPQ